MPPTPELSDTKALMDFNEKNRQRLEALHPTWPKGMPRLPGVPGRPYMAGLGRFLTAVRLEEWLGGEQSYAYALSNPTTNTDPSGLAPCSPGNPCSAPCAYAKSIGDDGGDGGGVVCCDGTAYPCVWQSFPPGYPPWHSQVHASPRKATYCAICRKLPTDGLRRPRKRATIVRMRPLGCRNSLRLRPKA